MKAAFWNERWETNQLGFHQSEVNSLLSEWWPRLQVAPEETVFVPLCGKSLDLHWLRQRGHPIIGVEFSPIAIRDFFGEAKLETETIPPAGESNLVRSSAEGYDLYCGDFFELENHHLEEVSAVFDRAALIALPPETRRRYATHLTQVLPQNVQIFLISLEYDQSKMSGPPHSVSNVEVEALFQEDFEVEELLRSPPAIPTPRFQERGLQQWRESVWRLTRK